MSSKEVKAFDDLESRLLSLSNNPIKRHLFDECRNKWIVSDGLSQSSTSSIDFIPLFEILVPSKNNWFHSNELCDFNTMDMYYGNNMRNNNGGFCKDKIINDWNRYIFFSPRCTQLLMDSLNIFKKEKVNRNGRINEFYNQEERTKLYQFEASSFRYSILKGNIRVIRINNKFGGRIEYIIFPFATLRSDQQCLYGLGQVNLDRPKPTNNRKHNKNGKNKRNNNNNNSNNNKNRQKWRCDGIYTMKGLIDFFAEWANCPINSQGEFESLLPKWPKIEETECEPFDVNLPIDQSEEISIKFKTSLYREAWKRSQERYNGSYNGNGNGNGNGNNNGKKGKKVEFSKFGYFIKIMEEMKIGIDEFWYRLECAINNSVNFAKNNPSTVLTQVYIDAKFARLYYEPILYCELENPINGKFYKFGLPMMRMNNPRKYIIKGLLTDKMAMDNVGLFNPQSRFTGKYHMTYWNSSMEDQTMSYINWYNKNAAINRELSSSPPAPIPSAVAPVTLGNHVVEQNVRNNISIINPVNIIIPPNPPMMKSTPQHPPLPTTLTFSATPVTPVTPVTPIRPTALLGTPMSFSSSTSSTSSSMSQLSLAQSVVNAPEFEPSPATFANTFAAFTQLSLVSSNVSNGSKRKNRTKTDRSRNIVQNGIQNKFSLPTINEAPVMSIDRPLSQFNSNIANMINSPSNNESALFSQIVILGKTFIEMCEQHPNVWFSVNKDNKDNDNIISVESNNGENGNDISEEKRLNSFWNVFKAFVLSLNNHIINKFGVESVIFEIIGEKQLNNHEKENNTFVELLVVFEKMPGDYQMALRRKKSNIKKEDVEIFIKKEKNDDNKDDDDYDFEDIVKPIKKISGDNLKKDVSPILSNLSGNVQSVPKAIF